MISFDEAQAAYQAIPPLGSERCSLKQCLHRVLAKDVHSPIDLPIHDQSAMDGYALSAADTLDACQDRPALLRIQGEVAAGGSAEFIVSKRSAARIFTGAWLPAGTDSVVPQENIRLDHDGRLYVQQAIQNGANVRFRGEEIHRGAKFASAGTRISPGAAGAFALAGIDQLKVHKQPRIGILVSGNELITPGSPLQAGQAYEANSAILTSLLMSWGYPPPTMLRIRDDLDETISALADAAVDHDLLITTGGVSVGDHDLIRPAAQAAGFSNIFWRVAQKPGKPLLFATIEHCLLLGMPGNPAAVAICALVHLRRILDCMEGDQSPTRWQGASLVEKVQADPHRMRLIRVRPISGPGGAIQLQALPHQGSHMLSNLLHTQGIAQIPPAPGVQDSGQLVKWLPV